MVSFLSDVKKGASPDAYEVFRSRGKAMEVRKDCGMHDKHTVKGAPEDLLTRNRYPSDWRRNLIPRHERH